MNAQDIRSLNDRMKEQMLNSKSVEGQDAGFKSLLLSLLSEMAAQGAESNENLRRILNPPLMYDTSNIDPADLDDLPQPVHFTVMGATRYLARSVCYGGFYRTFIGPTG